MTTPAEREAYKAAEHAIQLKKDAAEAMYVALQMTQSWIEFRETYLGMTPGMTREFVLRMIHAALAKAEGREP